MTAAHQYRYSALRTKNYTQYRTQFKRSVHNLILIHNLTSQCEHIWKCLRWLCDIQLMGVL